VVDLVINSCDTYFAKLLIFFVCSHFKLSQWILVKSWSCFSQDKKARNKFFGLKVCEKPSKSSKLSLLQNYHCKTNIGTELKTIKRTKNSHIFIRGLSFDEEGSIFD